jgi:hypothetical protein
MDNWDPSVVYQMATGRHHEDIARGEEAQRRAALLGGLSIRTRLTDTLIALAARLARVRLGALVPEHGATEAPAG